MGIQMKSQSETKCAYVEAVNRLGELFMYRMVRPWLRPKLIWDLTAAGREEKQHLKLMHQFTDRVIADRKAALAESKQQETLEEADDGGQKVKKPLLDLLLETGISDGQIRNEVSTFIFAVTTQKNYHGVCQGIFSKEFIKLHFKIYRVMTLSQRQ